MCLFKQYIYFEHVGINYLFVYDDSNVDNVPMMDMSLIGSYKWRKNHGELGVLFVGVKC